MRALNVPAAGKQPVLSDLPIPSSGEVGVLINVKAASLNPIDNAIASGRLSAMMPYEYPVVLGRDAAGIVEDVGSEVSGIEPGHNVVGHVLMTPPIHAGTLAEYAVMPAGSVTLMPEGLDYVSASAIPLAGASTSSSRGDRSPA